MRKLFTTIAQKIRHALRLPDRAPPPGSPGRASTRIDRRRQYWEKVRATHSDRPDPRHDKYLHSAARRRRAEA